MIENWNRWIHTSVAKHFETLAEENNIYLYVIGRSDNRTETNEYIDVRILNLNIDEVSKNYFKINLDIYITYSVHLSGYNAQRLSGKIENAMTNICIYKYGNGTDDDESLLGRLIKQREPIESNCFGQVENNRLIQGAVSASFKMTKKI